MLFNLCSSHPLLISPLCIQQDCFARIGGSAPVLRATGICVVQKHDSDNRTSELWDVLLKSSAMLILGSGFAELEDVVLWVWI